MDPRVSTSLWGPQITHHLLPTLAQPDLDKPFKVEVDVSNFATGAALMQWDDQNKAHPVAYCFQTLN